MIAVLIATLLSSYTQLFHLNAQNGDLTILGADNDANGVRDDVQHYIFETYPGDAQADLRAALLEVARSARNLLGAAQKDAADISDDMVSYLDARTCVYDIAGENAVADLGALQSKLYDTEARVRLYFRANEAFGGETYTFPDEPLSTCN